MVCFKGNKCLQRTFLLEHFASCWFVRFLGTRTYSELTERPNCSFIDITDTQIKYILTAYVLSIIYACIFLQRTIPFDAALIMMIQISGFVCNTIASCISRKCHLQQWGLQPETIYSIFILSFSTESFLNYSAV